MVSHGGDYGRISFSSTQQPGVHPAHKSTDGLGMAAVADVQGVPLASDALLGQHLGTQYAQKLMASPRDRDDTLAAHRDGGVVDGGMMHGEGRGETDRLRGASGEMQFDRRDAVSSRKDALYAGVAAGQQQVALRAPLLDSGDHRGGQHAPASEVATQRGAVLPEIVQGSYAMVLQWWRAGVVQPLRGAI